MKSETKSGQTRERVLDATARVLNQRGYAGTRLGDIAEVAEIQAPAIYYYFSSREDVIEEVIRVGQQRVLDHVTSVLDKMPAESTAMDRILAACGAHLRMVLTLSEYASASVRNFGQLPEEMRERQLPLRTRYGQLWRELFQAAVDSGEISAEIDPSVARMLVIGALSWSPEWWDPQGERGIDEVVLTAQRFIRTGLS